jgi:hypothetical protein
MDGCNTHRYFVVGRALPRRIAADIASSSSPRTAQRIKGSSETSATCSADASDWSPNGAARAVNILGCRGPTEAGLHGRSRSTAA